MSTSEQPVAIIVSGLEFAVRDYTGALSRPIQDDREASPTMRSFQFPDLLAEHERSGRPWLEFLREPALSCGMYHLRAGEEDVQRPHTEDEVYCVVNGRGRFWTTEEQIDVRPGTVIFVEHSVAHHFSDIGEDLTVLVFFAPAEGSRTDTSALHTSTQAHVVE